MLSAGSEGGVQGRCEQIRKPIITNMHRSQHYVYEIQLKLSGSKRLHALRTNLSWNFPYRSERCSIDEDTGGTFHTCNWEIGGTWKSSVFKLSSWFCTDEKVQPEQIRPQSPGSQSREYLRPNPAFFPILDVAVSFRLLACVTVKMLLNCASLNRLSFVLLEMVMLGEGALH
jgi:hypothetical protein